MYRLEYNLAAFLLMLVIIWYHFYKRQVEVRRNTMFLFLCACNILGIFFDILWGINVGGYVSFPMWFNRLNCYGYFMFHNLIPFAYSLYIMSVLDLHISSFTRRHRILFLGPGILSVLVILTTPFTNGVFFFDINGDYQRGSLQIILYLVSFFYTIYSAVYCSIYRGVLTRRYVLTLYSFVIIAYGAVLFQVLVPQILIESFAISICILLILLIIQRPEESLDVSTGALNRYAFDKSYRINEISHTQNRLLLIYLEDKELLSHSLGMEFLDNTYRKITSYLNKLRKNSVFYLHSDTFAILFRGEKEDAQALLEEIRDGFQNRWGNQSGSIPINARFLLIPLEEEIALEDIYVYADCLRTANSGHAVYQIKDFDLGKHQRRVDISASIKRAIEKDSFEIYYQPIYSVKEGRINCVEALLRLQDKVLGYVSPGELVPIAEAEGSIVKIGEMVFHKVFRFMKENDLASLGIDYVEINLSVVQAMQEDLCEMLVKLSEEYQVNPRQINLEITETAAASMPKRLRENMELLYKKGFTFSLDDFGTGYSNISSLISLPLDIIKFDKSVINMLDTGRVVIESSAAMVKRMNLKIVAEGVETEEQKKILSEMGMDYLQGYYFSKPVPGEVLLQKLKQTI